jgi:hypothetical protein
MRIPGSAKRRIAPGRPAPFGRGTGVARSILALGTAVLLAFLPGCVQRRLTIRSNPPGALVYIDNYEIGVTPVSTDFIYYGSREIRLIKDGYETQTRMTAIDAPWYQYTPIDFFAENVVPYEIRDQRTIDFQLVPQIIVPTEELLGRADELRFGSRSTVTPLPLSPQPAPLPGGYPVEVIPPGEAVQTPPEFRFPN